MTKEEAVKLGIASQHAREFFTALAHENTKMDPAERDAQIVRYERARADMHEAMNRHHAALSQLGLI